MVKRWVVNASPIISLTKIDRIHLLSELCDEVVIPQGVADEILLGGYADSAVLWLQETGQTLIKPATNIDSRIASWDLGLGESQVLSWVINHDGYEAIIDDLAARKAAQILQIPVRGTLAVIILAKQMGYISSVKQDLENLVQVGLPKILGLKPRPSRTALYYNIGVRVTSNVGRTTTNLTNSIVKVRGFQHNPC